MVQNYNVILFYAVPRYNKNRTSSATGKSGLKLLVVTLKLLKEKNQIFILPIIMFIGAEQAFLFADYNAVSALTFSHFDWSFLNIFKSFVLVVRFLCMGN